ncbi:Transcription factor BIM2 [Hirschfeldia incana]|nr:Transcription factor BIM2 [Hirschfeldia incana]
MRTGKANQEEDDYGEEDFSSKREGPSSSNNNNNNSNSATAASRDAKENDKASAIRSKHSVTEQRRRSKINERFQILREIIPNSEQKRDTASFLLEVIDYVQYLQEKVHKYEGSSYPGWSQEPTKLTPWRNNHWRVQSLANHPVAVNNGSVPVIPFPGKFEENSVASFPPAVVAELQNPVAESDQGRGAAVYKPIDSHRELDDGNKELPPVQPVHPFVHGEQGTNEFIPETSDGAGQSNNDLVVEGGTISISTAYSHELLSSLTQALQNAGVDLSHAKLSVQIDLGKRASQGLTHNDPQNKNPYSSDTEGATRSRSVEGESERSHKRMKTL